MAVRLALFAGRGRLHPERCYQGWPVMLPVEAKACEEIIGNLPQRLSNDAATELQSATEEQRKITHLRLQKLIAS